MNEDDLGLTPDWLEACVNQALRSLKNIIEDPEASAHARLQAANAIIERVRGKDYITPKTGDINELSDEELIKIIKAEHARAISSRADRKTPRTQTVKDVCAKGAARPKARQTSKVLDP